jgi:hypothetical protein
MTSPAMIKTAGDLLRGIIDFINGEKVVDNFGDFSITDLSNLSKDFITIQAKARGLARLIKENYQQRPSDKEIRDIKTAVKLLESKELITTKVGQGEHIWIITLHFNQIDVEEAIQRLSTNERPQTKKLPIAKTLLPWAVYQPQHWVERSNLSSDLTTKLQNNYRLLLLVGISGIGKTAQAERIIEKLRLYQDWIEIRRNCEVNNNRSFIDFAINCLNKTKHSIPKPIDGLLTALAQQLIQHPYLILIDSAEYLLTGNAEQGWGHFQDPLWRELFTRILSAEFCQSRLIITSQDEMTELQSCCERYQQVWYPQIIVGWQQVEQISFFQSHSPKLNLTGLTTENHPLQIIGQVYDGHPLVLEVICGEIKEKYNGSVDAYWQENKIYIQAVAEEIAAARAAVGKSLYAADRWQIHNYTRVLARIINERLEKTLQRLKEDAYLAYSLLCLASQYRIEVAKEFWLTELEVRNYLDMNANQQALDLLDSRHLIQSHLVEIDDRDIEGNIITKQEIHRSIHNLIRSLAITHRIELFGQ